MNTLVGMGGRLIWKVGLALVAGLLAFAALGVGLAALYLWMLPGLTPPAALGLVAGILLVLALLAYALAAHRRPMPAQSTLTPELTAVLPDTADLVRRAVAADPGAAVLGAVAAGFIMESKPVFDLTTLVRLVGQIQR